MPDNPPERIWIDVGEHVRVREEWFTKPYGGQATSIEYVRADILASQVAPPADAVERARKIVDEVNKLYDIEPSGDDSCWAEYDRVLVDRIAAEIAEKDSETRKLIQYFEDKLAELRANHSAEKEKGVG